MRRLVVVAALLLGFFSSGAAPAAAQWECRSFDFLESPGPWLPIVVGYSVWDSGVGWGHSQYAGRNGIRIDLGYGAYVQSVSVTLAAPLGGSYHVVLVSGGDVVFTYGRDFSAISSSVFVVDKYTSWLWVDPATNSSSYDLPHPSNIIAVTLCGDFPNLPSTPTLTPTATGTPLPTSTPLMVWLPTTDYRPICTVVSELNLTETAVAPSPFPSLVVPTMATYILQVPTLFVPTMVIPGAPTLTPSLSPTASLTPWPTLNLPTVTPTNTRTPTPTLTCRLPDPVYPVIDVGGLIPERDPQCFALIGLIDWHIPSIDLILFDTPEVDFHVPEIDICVNWIPLRLSILGIDFTGVISLGLAVLGIRFILSFRREM